MARSSPAVPAPRRRRPLPNQMFDAMYDLEKVVNRIERLIADDRFPQHTDSLRKHQHELARAAVVVEAARTALGGAG